MADYKALCARMADELDHYRQLLMDDRREVHALATEARAALAEPEPDEPTDEELLELMPEDLHKEFANWSRIYAEHADIKPGLFRVVLNTHAVDFARAVFARWGRPTPQVTPETSDGYHTFAELYEHRHSLMLALMHSLPSLSWFSLRHADGELPFGDDKWFIVGIQLPTGPITYHLPIRLLDLARKTGAQELKAGRPWDGHTADEVVSRLLAWASSSTPQPADGEVAELVAWLREDADDYDCIGEELASSKCNRAADLLERLSPPQPIPVSERLPRPAEWVWHCYAGVRFWEHGIYDGRKFFIGDGPESQPATHWLPAHALPLPS